ncbi:hypothetical protein L210DRAFT_3343107, partial [Boletus edulis BED1]
NILSKPFVIVCLINLHTQWSCEFEQFLKQHTFNIMPYIRKYGTRKDWWQDILSKSKQHTHHQIILA